MRLPLLAVTLAVFLSLPMAASAARSQKAAAPVKQYKAAIVVDCATGAVLHQENAHDQADPASLVKMMVTLIAMERIKAGEMHLTDTVTVSERAQHIGGHRVRLIEGETFSVEEMLKAVMIGSANDAAFAMAEHMAGSQDGFVELMNKRAEQLGLADTKYFNAHGLPPDRRKGQKANYTSAYDISVLARELMKHPTAMKWSSTVEDTFRDARLINTNHHFLEQFPGADGLKTGFHAHGAGFNVAATAVRDGRRLLSVVLGSPTKYARVKAAKQLLDDGFNKLDRTAKATPKI